MKKKHDVYALDTWKVLKSVFLKGLTNYSFLMTLQFLAIYQPRCFQVIKVFVSNTGLVISLSMTIHSPIFSFCSPARPLSYKLSKLESAEKKQSSSINQSHASLRKKHILQRLDRARLHKLVLQVLEPLPGGMIPGRIQLDKRGIRDGDEHLEGGLLANVPQVAQLAAVPGARDGRVQVRLEAGVAHLLVEALDGVEEVGAEFGEVGACADGDGGGGRREARVCFAGVGGEVGGLAVCFVGGRGAVAEGGFAEGWAVVFHWG